MKRFWHWLRALWRLIFVKPPVLPPTPPPPDPPEETGLVLPFVLPLKE